MGFVGGLMPISYDETVQVVLDLLQRALKAEARIKELETLVNEMGKVKAKTKE